MAPQVRVRYVDAKLGRRKLAQTSAIGERDEAANRGDTEEHPNVGGAQESFRNRRQRQ